MMCSVSDRRALLHTELQWILLQHSSQSCSTKPRQAQTVRMPVADAVDELSTWDSLFGSLIKACKNVGKSKEGKAPCSFCSITHILKKVPLLQVFMGRADVLTSYLSKAGCVHRLRVVLLAEVQVMHVEGTSGDTHTFSYFIVLL